MRDEPTYLEPRQPGYERWARWMIRFRWLVIALTIVAVGAMAYMVQNHGSVDTSVEAFAKTDSESHQVLLEYRRDFGRDSMFFVLIKGDVFTMPFLERLKALHDELKGLDLDLSTTSPPADQPKPEAPAADDGFGDFGDDEGWGEEAGGSVVDYQVSLINARRTYSRNGSLVIGELMDPFPTADGLAALKAEVLADRTLVGQVVSPKGDYSVIGVRTQQMSPEDSQRVYEAMAEIGLKHNRDDFKVYVGGLPALNSALNILLMSDLTKMLTASVIVMLVILIFLFRHPLAVLPPLFVVAASAIITVGLMATMGIAMTMLTNILPAFLFCVGIGHSVHLISVYRDAMVEFEDSHEAVVHALATTGVPIFYTSLTTMVGLLSFHFASLEAIRQMGYSGAFAIMVAFILSVTFLPAVISFNRTSLMGRKPHGGPDFLDRFLNICLISSGKNGDDGYGPEPAIGIRRRRKSLTVMVCLFAVGVAGASTLGVYHNPLAWIPDEVPIKQAFDQMDEHMGGTANVQILIDPREGDGLKNVETLRGLEKLQAHIESYEDPLVGQLVGNTISVLDVVKETHRALTSGESKDYRLPDTDRGVGDMFFMFESAGPEELRRLAVNDLSRTQMTIRIKWLDATSYFGLTDHIAEGVKTHIPEGVKARPTGSVYTLVSTIGQLIMDLISSFSVAFVVITIIMMMLLGSVKLGVIAMVPNLMPIVMIMGIMGLTGIPIDMNNLLIASISIGIAVDDTVHLLHHYRVNYERSGNVEDALTRAMHHSGRAMTSTSIILMLGFFTYMAADMANIERFGFLIGLTAVMALLIDLFFAPALIRTVYPRVEGSVADGQNPPDEPHTNLQKEMENASVT